VPTVRSYVTGYFSFRRRLFLWNSLCQTKYWNREISWIETALHAWFVWHRLLLQFRVGTGMHFAGLRRLAIDRNASRMLRHLRALPILLSPQVEEIRHATYESAVDLVSIMGPIHSAASRCNDDSVHRESRYVPCKRNARNRVNKSATCRRSQELRSLCSVSECSSATPVAVGTAPDPQAGIPFNDLPVADSLKGGCITEQSRLWPTSPLHTFCISD
jgi:hypothetical protein